MLDELIGSRVEEVVVVGDRDDELKLRLADGRVASFSLDGDCCSYSYFTDVHQFDELVGTTILEAEERHGGDSSEKYPDEECGNSVSWHFLVFKTSKGHVTIDWRNDSNGYYDGSLIVSL